MSQNSFFSLLPRWFSAPCHTEDNQDLLATHTSPHIFTTGETSQVKSLTYALTHKPEVSKETVPDSKNKLEKGSLSYSADNCIHLTTDEASPLSFSLCFVAFDLNMAQLGFNK